MTNAHIQQTVLVEIDDCSCSGIIIDSTNGYILTHASLLQPLLSKKKSSVERLRKHGRLDHEFLSTILPSVKVTVESLVLPDATLERFSAALINVRLSDTSARNVDNRLHQCTGTVQKVWRFDRFAKTVASMFPVSDEWRFWDNPDKTANETDENKKLSEVTADHSLALLPCFVLVSVGDSLQRFMVPSSNSDHRTYPIDVGTEVFVVGTPFGHLSPAVFINSISKGVISNIAGSQGDLLLTDARCIPGTEGGAIYSAVGRRSTGSLPVGVVVAPLCWKVNEWIGLSIGCRLEPLLQSMFDDINANFDKNIDNTGQSSLSDYKRRSIADCVPVVMVYTKTGSWGSGLIISQTSGLVLTCGHVVKSQSQVKIKIVSPSVQISYTADVIFSAEPGAVYDLAVLKLRQYRPDSRFQKDLVVSEPDEGDDVFVVGHAGWNHRHHLSANVTSGVVSKVIHRSSKPILIQSTCTVNSGASGGPLISQDGRLVGIVVCNARDTVSGAYYPHVNLSVPAVTIWPILTEFIRKNNVDVLRQLSIDDSTVCRVWKLETDSMSHKSSLHSKL